LGKKCSRIVVVKFASEKIRLFNGAILIYPHEFLDEKQNMKVAIRKDKGDQLFILDMSNNQLYCKQL
jgi:hypothetical protein